MILSEVLSPILDVWRDIFALIPKIAIIDPDEGGILIRFGKYVKTLGPCWKLHIPAISTIRSINVVPQALDLGVQSLTTTDHMPVMVSGGIVYAIKDVKKALLEVQDYDKSIQTLAMKWITNYVMSHKFDECLDCEKICMGIHKELRKNSHRWGIDIQEVLITDFSKGTVVRIASKNDNARYIPMVAEE